VLKEGDIPTMVTHLRFGTSFNQSLKAGDIPNSVTNLTFGFYFNQPLKKGNIPNMVSYLRFGTSFNQPLKEGDIPNNVTNLIFGHTFNQMLKKNDIPNSVIHLTFGSCFNQMLQKDDIPNSVTHLTFGEYFNQELNDYISNHLIELVIPLNYTMSKLKSNKDILIGYLKNNDISYHEYNFRINFYEKISIHNHILHIDVNKLHGRIILKELVEKVFHPSRLLKISNKYNIDFIDLIEIYS
jgi:hypothetical protein